jgi:hypothetical protein
MGFISGLDGELLRGCGEHAAVGLVRVDEALSCQKRAIIASRITLG